MSESPVPSIGIHTRRSPGKDHAFDTPYFSAPSTNAIRLSKVLRFDLIFVLGDLLVPMRAGPCPA